MNIVKKTVAAALAAVTLALAVAPTPAQAGHRFPRGAGIAGAIFGGLILGTIAAAAAEHERCGFVRQPILDMDGEVVGYRRVRYCG